MAMVNIYDIDPTELIEKTAEELRKLPEIKQPKWASFVKTGRFKERPPVRQDWWHTRAAALLRAIYRLGPVGVSKLRVKYGGKANRGSKPEHHYKASGAIIRRMLQQLEKAELIKQTQKGAHKGRILTGKGVSLLTRVAKGIAKEEIKEVKVAAKEEPKEAKPKEKKKAKVPKEKEKPEEKNE